ncbi:uncharacterized protein LOC110728809 [Chenopodium quinoa]|uniref:uncharacterized protein LOC110686115 n=1 Tax=Chenopodium quinoa TaxID=63459 RepID=UPI000B77E2D7|nr:uncharacterized protein LOC110686115 [Chenopodium quinoa]XP_021764165.1 uncharacterized protein LOC110728809 [Chenopodium quinoa]
MKRCPGQRFMAIYQHVHFSRMRKNSTSTSTLSLLPLTLNHDRTQTPALPPPPTLAPPLLPPPCCCPPPSHTHSLNFVIRWTVKIVRLDPLTLLCLHYRAHTAALPYGIRRLIRQSSSFAGITPPGSWWGGESILAFWRTSSLSV